MAKESMSAIAGMAGFPSLDMAGALAGGMTAPATSGGPFGVGDRSGHFLNFGSVDNGGQTADFKMVGLVAAVSLIGLVVVLKMVK